MKISSRYMAHPQPSLPLAVVTLLVTLGSVASDGSGWAFKPSAPCPVVQFRSAKPRPLRWTACPDNCRCSSTEAEIWCPGPTLPQLADADAEYVEVMVVEDVEISRLESHHFSGLERLHRLTLSNGRITEIAVDAFRDLTLLRQLDLSNNEIFNIPMDTFFYNKNLRILVLDGNPLYVPPSDPLLRSTSLGSLSIQGCGIQYVKSQTFVGVPGLYEILMEDNPLTEFPSEAVSHLKRLCYIGVDLLVDDIVTHTGDPNVDVATHFDVRQILIISGGTLVVVLAIIGVCRICTTVWYLCRRRKEVVLRDRRLSRNNRDNSSQAPQYEEVTERHMVDGRRDYRLLSQREPHLPTEGYPGYVYNGVDRSRERYSFAENTYYSPATNYRKPTDRLPLPPPYETVGKVRLPSRQESIATSTSDLRSSVVSDDENV